MLVTSFTCFSRRRHCVHLLSIALNVLALDFVYTLLIVFVDPNVFTSQFSPEDGALFSLEMVCCWDIYYIYKSSSDIGILFASLHHLQLWQWIQMISLFL